MKKIIFALLLLAPSLWAAPPTPFVLKWDSTFATPKQKGLVSLAPGTEVALDVGRTNDIFALFGVPIPEEEAAHLAVSMEFRFRFLRGSTEIAKGVVHTDKRGVFQPAVHPTQPWHIYRPASQALSSTETFAIPEAATALEIQRAAINTLLDKTILSPVVTFRLTGNVKTLLISSGDTRGDEKAAPNPRVVGRELTAGDTILTVFDQMRAMNAWVRTTTTKTYNGGIVATYSGSDARTITCTNRDTTLVYYSAWADLPLFETTTYVRFDQGDWQKLPTQSLYPAWGSSKMKNQFPLPFHTLSEIFRAADPHWPELSSTIFPIQAGRDGAAIHMERLTIPSDAKTLSVQTKIHAYHIAYYGGNFEGTPYVGHDCVRLFREGQRIELEDLWDTPDFTPNTAWTFPISPLNN